jgi:dienelactone hydrolase
MKTETIRYEADGLKMAGYLAFDEKRTGARPGVLVFPEIYGLGEHAKERAECLASEFGYTALACDLHGEGRVAGSLEEAMGMMTPIRSDPERVRARARGALDVLAKRPEVNADRVAAIGFCFGGTMALELARGGAKLAAVIGFHSGLATTRPEDAKAIKGSVLVCIGADDPHIPIQQRTEFEREMREGGVQWQMSLYGGVVHSFTNKQADKAGKPEAMRYDARADARSWAEMGLLFNEVFQ